MARIKTSDTTLAPLSSSVQMYLVSIARLWEDKHPVPLSQLAEALSISPVSVNEMCRKLQENGLVIYQPYKGVLLTPKGEQRAYYILRRHRLWEVFLVEKLGLNYVQAHEAACQLEHSTPNLVADRLDTFLEYPLVNPEGEPIPKVDASLPELSHLSLAALSAGQHGHVISCDVSDTAQAYLDEQGVRPGATLTVVVIAQDNLLVRVGETHVSLARVLAEAIKVELEKSKDKTVECTPPQSTLKEDLQVKPKTQNLANQMPLHKLKVGQRGLVVRVGGKGPAKRRMMDMGLVTGAEVKVIRVAPLGDPVEFEVKGYNLSLRKSEAQDIIVEMQTEEKE